MRLFVAVGLSDEARQAIVTEQQRIAAALGAAKSTLRWVKPEHAHLTLVFIGDVEDARVPALADAMRADVALPPFEMVLEGEGVFPPRGAPRALWVGVTQGADPLSGVQREIARRIGALGIALEDRPFHPHLTLARWRDARASDRERALSVQARGAIARFRVDRAVLFQSRLSSAGPTYTALAHANLTGGA
jgi:2'-5' RNA ligase